MIDQPSQLVIDFPMPIKIGDKEYSQMTLREPTGRQRRLAAEAMDGKTQLAGIYNSEITLVALVAGIPVSVVERLPVTVLDRAIEYLQSFFGSGRATGASSAPGSPDSSAGLLPT